MCPETTRLRTPARVQALVFATAAATVSAIAATWTGPPSVDFLFWLGVCFVGEALWVRLPLGLATASMASCFHFAVLLVLPRGHAMAIAALSGFVGELGFMRKPPLRALFNASQAALAVGAAGTCLLAFRPGAAPAAAPPGLAPGLHSLMLLAAAAAYFAVNKGAVAAVVALHERLPFARVWRANFGGAYELLASGALFSLGALLASHYAVSGIGGTLLVVLPLLVTHEGYRRYARRRASRQPGGEEVGETA